MSHEIGRRHNEAITIAGVSRAQDHVAPARFLLPMSQAQREELYNMTIRFGTCDLGSVQGRNPDCLARLHALLPTG
jgi:hypothetical protein